MNITLSPEIQSFLHSLREFVREEILPLEPLFLSHQFEELQPQLDALRQKAKSLGYWLPQIHSEYGGVLGPGAVLLAELLLEKRDQAFERVFRALGILNPKADLRSVYDASTSDDEQRQTAAREIVEDLLPASVRDPLFAMLDDVPLGTSDPPRAYDEVLQDLLEDPSDSLRCVAAHHVAERRLFRLRPLLARLRPASPIERQAFEQAIARLDA